MGLAKNSPVHPIPHTIMLVVHYITIYRSDHGWHNVLRMANTDTQRSLTPVVIALRYPVVDLVTIIWHIGNIIEYGHTFFNSAAWISWYGI